MGLLTLPKGQFPGFNLSPPPPSPILGRNPPFLGLNTSLSPPPGLLVPRGLVVGSRADRIAHHTAELCSPQLVVRRGQPFHLRVLLPRPFDPEDDSLCVELLLG